MTFLNPVHRQRFLLPLSSICAVCVGLSAPAIGQDADGNDTKDTVTVTPYETVDIAVQDADLAQVLQMLSLQSRKNIITSRNVSATVSANLYDVTFYEALDAILKVNGYTYNEVGNFIYVYTIEEFSELQDAQRRVENRIFDLDHLAADDVLEFITPLLSDGGTATARGGVSAGIQPTTGDAGADEYAYNVKVVVVDYPENIEAISALIEELDTPPAQVLVEATIVSAAVNEANAFGVDFSIVANMNFTDIVAPLNPVNDLVNGLFSPSDNNAQGIQSNPGNTSGPGTFKLGIVTDDISIFLRALDQVTDTVVLARPKLMALNRQRAEVLVGARVGYLSTTATATTTTQTVEFLDTGIQLIFRPFISKDGSIRMELHPSVSEASLRTVTDSGGAQVTIPDQLTNEMTTNVRIHDGQTLVLGGLFRESTTISRRQVPLLGDIPILGTAFRGQDDSVDRQEIIFLITASITKDEVLWENGDEMMAFAELVRLGSREGLLPFGRTKMTDSYNQNAIAAQKAGDTDLALYHLRNSLRLNPHQPNAIAMRQQITGDIDHSYERSMMERVIHTGIERNLTIDAVHHSNAGDTQIEKAFDHNPMLEVQAISPVPTDDDESISEPQSQPSSEFEPTDELQNDAGASIEPDDEYEDFDFSIDELDDSTNDSMIEDASTIDNTVEDSASAGFIEETSSEDSFADSTSANDFSNEQTFPEEGKMSDDASVTEESVDLEEFDFGLDAFEESNGSGSESGSKSDDEISQSDSVFWDVPNAWTYLWFGIPVWNNAATSVAADDHGGE